MRLVCVYYIVYSLIRLKKATDANCPNKHFVSPHGWPDCHHSFQPQAPSLLSVKHVTFRGVDYTGKGQPKPWISPFPTNSAQCPTRKSSLYPTTVLHYSPFFFSSPQSREERRACFLPLCSNHLHNCIYVIVSLLSLVFILNNLSSFSLLS